MLQQVYEEDYLYFYDALECKGDLGEKWCNFKWRIYNIHLNPISVFQSPIFTTRLLPNAHWYLEVELLSPGDLRTMRISLKRLQKHKKIALLVDTFYKIIWDEEVKTTAKDMSEYNERSCDETLTYSVTFCKPKKNYITVECKLRPNKRMIQSVCHRNLDKYLPIHLRRLLQSGEFFDTIIRVGKYRLTAHIAILHARLPQLLEKCHAPSKENGKHIINIKDLPLPVVKEMLKYAYTGQAYVDVESFPIRKEVYASYSQNFFQSCCWEDNPFAQTFFTYETDSLSWQLKDVFKNSNLGSQTIDLLRLYPSKLKFSLDVDESENGEKWLMLTFEFLSDEMPKAMIVSCHTLLVNKESNETLELGETESFLQLSVTKGKMKLCSLLDVQKGVETVRAKNNPLILQTDFKFCYGSSTSSIENIYEGQFEISNCTNCLQLSADMEALYRSSHYFNIKVESGDGREIRAHKAILFARWPEAEKHELEENIYVVIKEHGYEALDNYLLQLYNGKDIAWIRSMII